tara:strand:+ start:121 stop:609 length:489 start_codon:yes stop_codon:yes gene_type:complete
MVPIEVNDILKPGDTLLYSPKGIFGWLISIKTWNAISHTEIYIGDGYSVAARGGVGVGTYPVRLDQLIYIYRPNKPFKLAKALKWYLLISRGQRYDWWGLIRFAWRSKIVADNKDNKQFCSEFATRFYRAGGLDLFNKYDADAVAPFMFSSTPYLDLIWKAE